MQYPSFIMYLIHWDSDLSAFITFVISFTGLLVCKQLSATLQRNQSHRTDVVCALNDRTGIWKGDLSVLGQWRTDQLSSFSPHDSVCKCPEGLDAI